MCPLRGPRLALVAVAALFVSGAAPSLSRDKTFFTFEFDVTLPIKDAAAGLACK
jgi:hypothetical protein